MTELEFQNKTDSIQNENIVSGKLCNGWYQTSQTENEFKRFYVKDSISFFITPRPKVLTDNFSQSREFENNQGIKGLAIILDKIGAESWSETTLNNIGSRLVFILDNIIITAPIVNAQITNGNTAFWKNETSSDEWKKLKEFTKK